MRLKDYNERDGKRVWLSESEIQRLIPDRVNTAGTEVEEERLREQRAALLLAGRCGLRRGGRGASGSSKPASYRRW